MASNKHPAKLKAIDVDDVSLAVRIDGQSGVGGVRHGRVRKTNSTIDPMSPLEAIEAVVVLAPLWDIAAEFDRPRNGPGRPLETIPFCILLVEVLAGEERSVMATVRLLRDKWFWTRLRAAVALAWPDHPERRLPELPPSREQYLYFRKTRLEFNDAIARIRELLREMSIEMALSIGICDPTAGSVTHPLTSQVLAGDATSVRALFNTAAEDAVDKVTGEILTRRFDPDAVKYHNEGEKCGFQLVSVLARNPHPRERTVIDQEIKPRGVGDATVFTDMALVIAKRMTGARATTYDGAMHAGDYDRTLSAGLIPVTKTQLTKTGAQVRLNLGEYAFRKRDTTTVNQIIMAIHGSPCIHVPTAQGREQVTLVRRQTKIREHADGTCTIGGFWLVPNEPVVPKHLRDAEVWINHNSTADEILRKKPKTRALRVIPETDPDYGPLFGVREDTESMHNHMKRPLINDRVRSVGLHRVRLNFHGYQIRTNITAVLAHHYRTGASVERWFGAWHPPGARLLDAA